MTMTATKLKPILDPADPNGFYSGNGTIRPSRNGAKPPTPIVWEATEDDLYKEEGKAELLYGKVVRFMASGFMPGYAAGKTYMSLFAYAEKVKKGEAVGDGTGFRVNMPHRHSFSPDAAYYTGPLSTMRFLPQAPDFAVEVRSEGDYGAFAEEEMQEKRQDYFAAGTQVVWDVDLLNEPIVRKYVAPDADSPAEVYECDAVANAEPAVPGWTLAVKELFKETLLADSTGWANTG